MLTFPFVDNSTSYTNSGHKISLLDVTGEVVLLEGTCCNRDPKIPYPQTANELVILDRPIAEKISALEITISGVEHIKHLTLTLDYINPAYLTYFNGHLTHLKETNFRRIVNFLKRAPLEEIHFEQCLDTLDDKMVFILNEILAMPKCPNVFIGYQPFTEQGIKTLNLGNCTKLSVPGCFDIMVDRLGPADDTIISFIKMLPMSKITHLDLGHTIFNGNILKHLIDILPSTSIIALSLNACQLEWEFLANVPHLFANPKLKYLDLSYFTREKRKNFAFYIALANSKLKQINLSLLNQDIKPIENILFKNNITLIGFNDNNKFSYQCDIIFEDDMRLGFSKFLQRNILIQEIIKRSALTILMIKKYRLESIFRPIDINVVKIIARMVLDTNNDLIWLNLFSASSKTDE